MNHSTTPSVLTSSIFSAAVFLALVLTTSCTDSRSGPSDPDLETLSGQCPDSPAPAAFEHGVCICEDFVDIGNLIVGRGLAVGEASLAVNGTTVALNNTNVNGDFIAYGGLEAKANLNVARDLSSAGTVDAIGNIVVGADMNVGGDLTGVGRLSVEKALRVAGENRFIGFATSGSTEPYGNTPPPPCGCSEPEILDVASAVADARANNDNAAAGIDTSISSIGYSVLQFGDGSYYFDGVETIGATKFVIDGTVAIFIDGNLDQIGAQWIRLMPGATLDLYVSGAVRTIGHVDLGDKLAPSAFRLYVGGTDEASLNVGNQLFNGAIYAPNADLRYIGNTKVRGSLFAKSIVGKGNLVVGHASPTEPPEDCDDPEVETPEEEPPGPPDSPDPPPIFE